MIDTEAAGNEETEYPKGKQAAGGLHPPALLVLRIRMHAAGYPGAFLWSWASSVFTLVCEEKWH